jgi:hypothetical protein
MKATSQITTSTSFTILWGKTENFKSTNFYIQRGSKFKLFSLLQKVNEIKKVTVMKPGVSEY